MIAKRLVTALLAAMFGFAGVIKVAGRPRRQAGYFELTSSWYFLVMCSTA